MLLPVKGVRGCDISANLCCEQAFSGGHFGLPTGSEAHHRGSFLARTRLQDHGYQDLLNFTLKAVKSKIVFFGVAESSAPQSICQRRADIPPSSQPLVAA